MKRETEQLWRVNPDTPSVIITPHGRISISWSVQRPGDATDFSLAEQTAAAIVEAMNARQQPEAAREGEALFAALHTLERLRDLTPMRANETSAQGLHSAVKAIAETTLDNLTPRLAVPTREERIKAVSERILVGMRETARQEGWALALHGSMSRDLDVIAVPWTDTASDEIAFVEAMRASLARTLGGVALIGAGEDGRMAGVKSKPHGRRAWTIHSTSEQLVESEAGAHPYVDLCVMDARRAAPAPSVADLTAREALRAEIINTPETADFMAGVPLEATHQRERWGSGHDVGKTPFDWFWLIGYLAQKAAASAVAGDLTKAQHHTISTAAALANWHAQISGQTDMRPGIGPKNGGEKPGSAFDLASKLSASPAAVAGEGA